MKKIFGELKNNPRVLLNCYLLFCVGAFFSFVIFNCISNGKIFYELFYKLTDDATYDFYVFLNDTSTNNSAFSSGFNPPIVRLFFRLIYRSLPIKDQEAHVLVELFPSNTVDLRLNALALTWFVIIFSLILCTFFKIVFNMIEGSNVQKWIFSFVSILSIGVIWCVERGNIALAAMLFLLIFCNYYQSDNPYKRELAYISLALSISIKIYPIVFLLLLIKEKKDKDILRVIMYIFLLTFVPIICFNGFHGIGDYIMRLSAEGGTGNNLRAGYLNLKSILLTVAQLLDKEDFIYKNSIAISAVNYLLCMFISMLSVMVFKEKWKQYLILVIVMLFLPGISHTYMLCFFIIPIGYFFKEEKKINNVNVLFTIIFSLLTAILPIKNGEITLLLREKGEILEQSFISNRITGVMIYHEILVSILFVISIGMLICQIKKVIKNEEKSV